MECAGFCPVAGPDARVLILGTLPGAESLKRREYYANSRNSFWRIMGLLVGASPDLAYEERRRLLKKSHIALWDVCQSAERSGSSDSKILAATIKANDFRSFFNRHPHIELICFNGRMAETLFLRRVLPGLAEAQIIGRQVLASTSPANTRLKQEEKYECWRQGLSRVVDGLGSFCINPDRLPHSLRG